MTRTALILAVAAMMVVLSAGVALAGSFNGTKERDVIEGTKKADTISGAGGDDSLNGLGGKDTVRGGSGPDELTGGYGPDKVYGNEGNDNLIDSPDKDTDIMYGGHGKDTVQVRDFPAVKDVVYCGAGRDKVYMDRLDEVHGCEIKRLP